jgi:H+/Cl- antiporter ClcA
MINGLRLWYRLNDAPSSVGDNVGIVLMLCDRTRISVGASVGSGGLVYPSLCCDVLLGATWGVCVGDVCGVVISVAWVVICVGP